VENGSDIVKRDNFTSDSSWAYVRHSSRRYAVIVVQSLNVTSISIPLRLPPRGASYRYCFLRRNSLLFSAFSAEPNLPFETLSTN
jgi:hypothetical protein